MTLRTAACTVVAAAALTACAGPSLEDEAKDLRQALADLPGVAKVDLHYTEPVTLDSGKLQLRVELAADADPTDAIDVVATAYEGFSGTHHGEEGDIDVVVADDTIHVRSFEPDAKVGAVEQAAADAVSVLGSGVVRADINTQDVAKSPHVFTTFSVMVAGRSGDDVLGALTELELAHADIPHAGWGVQSHGGSGWELKASKGFPGAAERALFDRLRSDVPRGSSVFLADDDFVNVQVAKTASPDEVSVMVERHLTLLGGIQKAFYDVTQGEDFYTMITRGDCTFAPGAFGDRLKQDLGDTCTKITKVDP